MATSIVYKNKYINKQCCLIVIGLVLTLFGTIFSTLWADIFNEVLYNELKLGPNTRSYHLWKSPPIPMHLDLYFFNWTNSDNFTDDEYFVKPILKQCGPYRFTELVDKDDIEWHKDNSTISFKRKNTYHFDAAGSNGTLTDMITTLNIVALAAANAAKYWPFIHQKTVSLGLKLYQQQVAITKTASELLFEGYQDSLIDTAHAMPASLFAGQNVTMPFDRFGWFYMRNGTGNLTGHFNMHTGQTNISQIGVVKNWNYNSRTDFYPGPCGMINGSAAEFYPPNQQRDKPISFYTPDMCRSLSFDYVEDVVINGVKGYKYSGGPKTVDNGTLYPENSCFSNGEVVPSGVMNVSACRFGTPAFMSFPHYYLADKYFVDQVTGLNPTKNNHEFYLIIEPRTGVVLEVAARLQINMLVRPIKNIALYENVPETFFPVLWFEQKVRIPEDMAHELKLVPIIEIIGYVCSSITISLGIVLILWYLVIKLRKRKPDMNKIDSIEINQTTGKVLPPEGSPLITKNGNKKEGKKY